MLTLPTLSNSQHPVRVWSHSRAFAFIDLLPGTCFPDLHVAWCFTSFKSQFLCHLSEKPSLTIIYKIGLALDFLVFPIPLTLLIFLCAVQHPRAYFCFCIVCLLPLKYKPHKDRESLLIIVCSVPRTILGLYLGLNKCLLKAWIIGYYFLFMLHFPWVFQEKKCVLIQKIVRIFELSHCYHLKILLNLEVTIFSLHCFYIKIWFLLRLFPFMQF